MEKNSDISNVVQIDFKSRNKPAPVSATPISLKKRELFDRWLEAGTVSVLFDARKDEVLVPSEFKDRGDLRLNFCHEFHVPDFMYNEIGVQASLSFDSGIFFCKVPWDVVYGLQSPELNQGAVFFECFPKDYDQMDVLGFTEEMCETKIPLADEGMVEPSKSLAEIVEFDFSKKT